MYSSFDHIRAHHCLPGTNQSGRGHGKFVRLGEVTEYDGQVPMACSLPPDAAGDVEVR